MLRFALCDDENSARAELRDTIATIPGYRRAADVCITEYRRGEDLLADIEDGFGWFDLIFMDIYMGGLTGMETAKRLRSAGNQTPIIFLTSSPDFAVEAFEVEAAGYLLKPVESCKLAPLMGKVLSPIRPQRVALQCGRERRYFVLGDILYAESEAHITRLHLRSGESAACGEKLSDLEKLFADNRFLRCHQSFLVNLEHIKDVNDDFILENGERIPIPIRRHKEMADAYYRFFVSAAIGRRSEDKNYV